ncbi:MAG: ATP-binding protein [Alphaproteobacteria bacterium]
MNDLGAVVYVETLLLCFTTLGCFCLMYYFYRSKIAASNFLDEVMEASDHGKIIFDHDGCFMRANKRAYRHLSPIVSASLEELTRETFLNCLYDNAADFDESVRNAVLNDFNKGDAEPSFREVIDCKDQGLYLVDATDVPGKMTVFNLFDIRMGQQREEDLIQLNIINRQLMLAIQATTTGIIMSDPKLDGNPILFANDAFCEFAGYVRQDLLGANWNILLNMFVDKQEREKFIAAMADPQSVDVALEVERDGQLRQFSMTLTPVFDNGTLDLFVGLVSEVTLLKQRESEFFHVQKLESLGQLAAGVAHDFNNILSIIGGYSVMANNLLGDEFEQAKGYLDKIDAASQRGAGLTRKMLTFSRHKVVEKSVVDVRDIIYEQKELLIPLLGVSVDLEVSIPDHNVNIRASADSLGQILMNLAINARDAMGDEGGVLSISVSCPVPDDVPDNVQNKIEVENLVCLSVSDTGTGMDDKVIERIFDPFFSTKEQGKGTGLGLSVVYGLVQEMGGVFDVSSKLGEGTNFSLYVPRCYEKQTKVITGDETDLSSICLDGFTALVAEDEPDLLLLVTNMLEDLGLKVIGAPNGDQALMLFEDNEDEIDILLTDVIMPEMNGVKLAELVTSLNPDVKVIFMSGYPANGDMAPVALPEDAAFMAKPVNYDALAGLLLQKLREGSQVHVSALEAMPQWKTSRKNGVGQDG